MYKIINSVMHSRIKKGDLMILIIANNLKTKVVKAIEEALLTRLKAPITVRGQVKYVVMSNAQY